MNNDEKYIYKFKLGRNIQEFHFMADFYKNALINNERMQINCN